MTSMVQLNRCIYLINNLYKLSPRVLLKVDYKKLLTNIINPTHISN